MRRSGSVCRARDAKHSTISPDKGHHMDEPEAKELDPLPELLESYPDTAFISKLSYQDKPHLTMVSGIPDSARSNDAFTGIPGSFFSSETAPEVILQKSFALELLGKTPPPGQEDDIPVSELAKPLLGQDLTMRYAQRVSAPSSTGENAASKSKATTNRSQWS